MASESRNSGGVRNLRAMFENKEESPAPPPDRGRSAAEGGGSKATSPRPLSKIRTNFVTVEKSGARGNQLGLQKETSGEPNMVIKDEKLGPIATAEKEEHSKTQLEATKNGTVMSETVPESVVQAHTVDTGKKLDDKKGKGKAADFGSSADQEGAATKERSPETAKFSSEDVPNGMMNGKAEVPATAKTVDKVAPTKTAPAPTLITKNKAEATSKSSSKAAKSPLVPTTPTAASKTPVTTPKATKALVAKSTSSAPAKRTLEKEEKSVKIPNKPAPAGKSDAQTSAPLSAGKARSHHHQPPPSSKSPTRPLKLPSSMTAPTASSLSKINGSPAVSHHPAHGSVPATAVVPRSPSRTSQSVSTGLGRHSSVIDKSRPSLSRPSIPNLRKQTSRQSLPSKASPPDGDFLARMTRPTTSSASKVHEKILNPPNPVITSRPSTRDGPAGRVSGEIRRGSPMAKKAIAAAKDAKTTKPNAEQSKPAQPKVDPSASKPAAKSTAKPAKVAVNGESSKACTPAAKTETIKSPAKDLSKPAEAGNVQPTTRQKTSTKAPAMQLAPATANPEEAAVESLSKAPGTQVSVHPTSTDHPTVIEAAVPNSSNKEQIPILNGETLHPVADEVIVMEVAMEN